MADSFDQKLHSFMPQEGINIKYNLPVPFFLSGAEGYAQETDKIISPVVLMEKKNWNKKPLLYGEGFIRVL
jgi:hypothetical protein